MNRQIKELLLIAALLFAFFNLPVSVVDSLRLNRISSYFSKKAPSEEKEYWMSRALLLENQLSALKLPEQLQPQQQISAQVIRKDPSSWGSFLWINVGSKTNQKLGQDIVSKNSAVVFGDCLVGVVEEVFDHHSKVRLITDKKCNPSVQVVRGEKVEQEFAKRLKELEPFALAKDKIFYEQLQKASQRLGYNIPLEITTVKGVLSGGSKPLWRSQRSLLKGIGFHSEESQEEDLLVGDLLETSGLDGIFPHGIKVAVITKIYPLEEGGYYYELEAKSLIQNLDEIKVVQVLSPL